MICFQLLFLLSLLIYLASLLALFFLRSLHSFISFCETNMTNTPYVCTCSNYLWLWASSRTFIICSTDIYIYIFYFNYKTFELLSSNWYIVKINKYICTMVYTDRAYMMCVLICMYECRSVFASQIPNDTLDNFVLNKCDKFNVCHA